ncbi:hypothetical protein GCM10017044_11180 [Kordiimonas sediminis]|uniref:Glycosyltransferase 2-like domain-containing protein n=1 Tax=Kordiimonas sediminis TaxID=1735581 RepID=A0A919E6C1_9PROT|nr:glycosyltransferase family A protein [Kordiimonas sediminis]GHF18420.1 hypothetical protein GCM10017044_11180 [Kordiimonas sediminis]
MARALRKLKKLFQSPLAYLIDSRHAFLSDLGRSLLERERQRLMTFGHTCADDKVTVIMTAYNTGPHIEKAVRSVMAQSHANLTLMVIDDASTDETPQILAKLRQEFAGRMRVFQSPVNHGTYWSKNWCMRHADGEFIAFHDSDDTSHPDRILLQMAAIKSRPHRMATTVQWRRVFEDGRTALIGGREFRMAAISLMIRREPVLRDMGYFDSVRISADSEYLGRLQALYGPRGLYAMQHWLYTGLLRDSSLTRETGSGMSWRQQERSDDKIDYAIETSGDRQAYMQSAKAWHARISQGDRGKGAHIPFPQTGRHLYASENLCRGCDDQAIDQIVEIT